MFLGALDKAKEVQEQLKTSIDPLSSVARTFLRSIDSKDAAGQSIESPSFSAYSVLRNILQPTV